MQYFLGVDGGGTGCRLRLAEASGRVLAEVSGGPSNIASDPEGALRNLLNATARAYAEAGLTEADYARTSAGLGLAGCNVVADPEWPARALPFGRVQVVTDARTSTSGALQGANGIVAAIGTGSVFTHLRDGKYCQIGGWGYQLGDEGSGAVLGRMRLAHTLRACDGIVPLTPLLQATLNAFPSPDAIVTFARSATPAEMARFAPDIFSAVNDEAAATILTQAASEIIPLINKLQGKSPLPVVWTGGLGPLWQAWFGARWPSQPALGTALDGAMALARAV